MTTSRSQDTTTSPAAAATPRVALRTVSLRELAGTLVLLFAIVLVFTGRHVLDGGFTLDDWAVYSQMLVRDGGYFDDIAFMADMPNIKARPGTAVFWATGMNVFGVHMGLWLAFMSGLAALFALSVHTFLRAFGFPYLAGVAVGALTVVTPIADTLRLWISGGGAQFPYALSIFAVLLSCYAFQARTRRRAITLHVVSLALYAISLLIIESALLLMLAAIVPYLLVSVNRRAVFVRWFADIAVLGAIYMLITRHTVYERQTLQQALDHAWLMVTGSRDILTTQILPFGNGTWWALVPLVALIGAGIVVAISASRTDDGARSVRRWLLLIGIGLFVVACAYAPYSFAHPYYSPTTQGMGNRTNGLAAVGWAMFIVGLFALAASLAFRGLERRRIWVGAFAGALVLLVGFQYHGVFKDRAEAYDDAFTVAESTLRNVKQAVPSPPQAAMFYVGGQPLEYQLGVPVFSVDWDLDGALKYTYDRFDVAGLPYTTLLNGATMAVRCDADTIVPLFNDQPAPAFTSTYGTTFFVDGNTGDHRLIDNRSTCRDVIKTWPASPALPG